EAEEDLAPPWRGHEAPALVCRPRRLDRPVDVLRGSPRERPDQLAVGGAPALEGLARGRRVCHGASLAAVPTPARWSGRSRGCAPVGGRGSGAARPAAHRAG